MTPEKTAWKKANRGRLKKIADSTGMSFAYVSMVFSGKRHNKAIERALKRAKVPTVTEVNGDSSDGILKSG